MKKQAVSLCAIIALVMMTTSVMGGPRPDSAGEVPLPGPGLSYGGIPYGSVSGNVAEFFKRQAPSHGGAVNLDVDFSPIEQWL